MRKCNRKNSTETHETLTQDSVRVKGVTDLIRLYFWRFPHESARQCCKVLHLDYDYYKNLCYRIKSETKKLLEGKVKGRVLVVPCHRGEWRSGKPLRDDVVATIEFEALKRRPGRLDPKPVDEWYVIPNRNRQMQFLNDFVSIRVFRKSGTCRVLPRKPMDRDSLKIYVQNAFFKAGLDVKDCEDLSEKLEPHSQHRVFKIGPVSPFKIDYYKDSLGLTLKANGSHPDHLETVEDWPSWIKPLLNAQHEDREIVHELALQIKAHLKVQEGTGQAVDRLNEAVDRLNETLNCGCAAQEPTPYLGYDLSVIIDNKKGSK